MLIWNFRFCMVVIEVDGYINACFETAISFDLGYRTRNLLSFVFGLMFYVPCLLCKLKLLIYL